MAHPDNYEADLSSNEWLRYKVKIIAAFQMWSFIRLQ